MQRMRALFRVYLKETWNGLLYSYAAYFLLVSLPSKFLHKTLALLGLDL